MAGKLFLSGLLFLCLFSAASAQSSEEQKAYSVLQSAASSLGWPANVFVDEDSEVGTATPLSVSSDGTEDADYKATVAVFSTDIEAGLVMDYLLGEGFGLEHSSYLGREARIQAPGRNCDPKGFIVVAIADIVHDIFGAEEDERCVTQSGVISWRCGKYFFVASDETMEGYPDHIAAALYAAAESEGLCGYGDTLFLMVDTPDLPGSARITQQHVLAQKVNQYFGVNTYAQHPPFSFTFLDADGPRGTNDWYRLPDPITSYRRLNFIKYQEDAIKQAFRGADLPQDLYFERVFILYPGESQQLDPNSVFYDSCGWYSNDYHIEVDAAQGKRRIYSRNFIFMSERRDLGTWVHEFGHSINSKYRIPAPVDMDRVSDRYAYAGLTYGQYGEISYWGLMGYGAWLGSNGDAPAHMMSFTKESAGWLTFSQAAMNKTYTITALEDMKAQDKVLTVDDPTSQDPARYYIVEARNSKTPFGAPETGVLLYKVTTRDGYYVVNLLDPQSGPRIGTAGTMRYKRPTLSSASPVYTDPRARLNATLVSLSDGSATVKVDEYAPVRLVGAVVAPSGPQIQEIPGQDARINSLPVDPFAPKPDIDLHAYDSHGNHIGMNYETNEYEVNIPGGMGSGDLMNDEEWIFVPEGTEVRFEVSAHKTRLFLEQNPEYSAYAIPQGYSVEMVKYDASGKMHMADGGEGTVTASADARLKHPNDPSLRYEQREHPGFGNNSMCMLLPGLVLVLLAAVFRDATPAS